MNRKLEGEWRSLVTGGSRGIKDLSPSLPFRIYVVRRWNWSLER
jgi:hypothetical protein